MTRIRKDFSEVAHTGGQVTFTVNCDENGHVTYQVRYSHSSSHPATLVGIHAHPDGFACGNIKLGGIGEPWNHPPLPNCVPVFMASDTQGNFGHECPECHRHFRTGSIPAAFPLTCPYCGLRAESFHFLTPPQKSYIEHYVRSLVSAAEIIGPESTSEIVIDMNVVADEVPDIPRPDFYYTSTTQQTEFVCVECNSYTDIRGRYGYCASCGCRNTVASQKAALDEIRNQLNAGSLAPNDAVKKAVSEFDSACRDYVEQLASRVPTKESRCNQMRQLLFHNIDKVDEVMKSFFDIQLLKGMESECAFVRKMLLRRHVYEHEGGVASARYVRESKDQDIDEGVLIRETVDNVHRLIGDLNRMVSNLDRDFQELFPPEPFCIEVEKERKASMGESWT